MCVWCACVRVCTYVRTYDNILTYNDNDTKTTDNNKAYVYADLMFSTKDSSEYTSTSGAGKFTLTVLVHHAIGEHSLTY